MPLTPPQPDPTPPSTVGRDLLKAAAGGAGAWGLLMVGADRWSARALTPWEASFNRRRFSGLGLQGPAVGILAMANAKGSDPFTSERAPTPPGSRGVEALREGGRPRCLRFNRARTEHGFQYFQHGAFKGLAHRVPRWKSRPLRLLRAGAKRIGDSCKSHKHQRPGKPRRWSSPPRRQHDRESLSEPVATKDS